VRRRKWLSDYLYNEGRYPQLAQAHPDTAAQLLERAQEAVNERREIYLHMVEQD
jgi:hypothetical protein